MRLAIMQPYFLPYLGYFSLIAETDCFVILDEVQYIRHGWINRNRILKPCFNDIQYIGIPVSKHSQQTEIRDIQIADSKWKSRILNQLNHYKKRTRFFGQTIELLESCFSSETRSIVDMNMRCLQVVCEKLKIPLVLRRSSSIDFDRGAIQHPGDWALQIAKSLNASAYINPINGRNLFSTKDFKRERVQLKFLQNELSSYPQPNHPFRPGLSILDVILFNGYESTTNLVKDYRLTSVTHAPPVVPAPIHHSPHFVETADARVN